MKKIARSYISFTRTERNGIIALCTLIVGLLLFRAAMPLWVHPAVDVVQEQKLTAAWNAYKMEHGTEAENDTARVATKEHQDESDPVTTPLPDSIDLNKADSATLVRLKGVGPVTAGKMVAWRKRHGDFTNIEQIRETGGFSQDVFELLKKHLVIRTSKGLQIIAPSKKKS